MLSTPRCQQRQAVDALLDQLGHVAEPEAWNSQFGPSSLFDAWTRTSVAAGVYRANREVLGPFLSDRTNWRVIEVGGGDGRLWQGLLSVDSVGELVVVDPAPEVHAQVAAALPKRVRLVSIVEGVETAVLPEADAVVCSLTLHHVAGRSANERAQHGLAGPGKVEVLRAMGRAVQARSGIGLLNEADVFCELELPSGSELLSDRLLDSYVRRCGLAMLDDLDRAGVDDDLRGRWGAVLRHWCLEQLAHADLPIEQRDVYELDVPRWLRVLDEAGLSVLERRFTDAYGLFHQYVWSAGQDLDYADDARCMLSPPTSSTSSTNTSG